MRLAQVVAEIDREIDPVEGKEGREVVPLVLVETPVGLDIKAQGPKVEGRTQAEMPSQMALEVTRIVTDTETVTLARLGAVVPMVVKGMADEIRVGLAAVGRPDVDRLGRVAARPFGRLRGRPRPTVPAKTARPVRLHDRRLANILLVDAPARRLARAAGLASTILAAT